MRVPVPSQADERFLLDVAAMLASRPRRRGPERAAGEPGAARTAVWRVWLGRMAEALTRGEARAAGEAWQRAYRAAFDSPRWEGMVEVGDAARRLARAGAGDSPAKAATRHCCLAALVRAAQAGAPDGVRRIAEAFAAIGEREAAAAARRIADRLAAASPDPAAAGRADSGRRAAHRF